MKNSHSGAVFTKNKDTMRESIQAARFALEKEREKT